MGQLKLVNLRVDSDLWHQAKVEAAKQQKSLQEYVAEAIQEKLRSYNAEQKRQSS